VKIRGHQQTQRTGNAHNQSPRAPRYNIRYINTANDRCASYKKKNATDARLNPIILYCTYFNGREGDEVFVFIYQCSITVLYPLLSLDYVQLKYCILGAVFLLHQTPQRVYSNGIQNNYINAHYSIRLLLKHR